MTAKPTITIETIVNAPISVAWKVWVSPEFIVQWNFANDEWCCPSAVNDLRPQGKFSWRMAAKDGSFAFDYSGQYTQIEAHKQIQKRLDDGRMVDISFEEKDDQTTVTETFEVEDVNSIDLQRDGWQAILNNYKKRVESQS